MDSNKKIWFPAKLYGWGWGAPVTWQGWAVTLIYILALILGVVFLGPRNVSCVVFFFGLTALFTLVCWIKGEKPRWRWGEK